ncbi:hypothetical protein [Leifsonia aquatica]|uniref:hypothetical protein n=1 Tax=Leifsonia aquatica TaxID=144185 RepID=UPI0004680EF1|nr:hypothetical protein [Leifsonia aquatica]
MTQLIDPHDFLTDEQRAEEVATWRLTRALREAPELFTHARALTLSRAEAGETLSEWNAPMRITVEDDASDAYARLGEWVENFAMWLNIAPPVSHIAAQRIQRGDMQGFRAGVTPEGAGLLVNLLTSWLAIHSTRIATHDAHPTYREDVTSLLWRLRSKYPLDRGRERDVLPRTCPECGIPGVQAEWWSQNNADVEVSCMICGFTIDPADYKRILEWILPQAERTTWVDSLKVYPRRCTGSADCSAPVHIHGCYADTDAASCEHDDEHPTRTAGGAE